MGNLNKIFRNYSYLLVIKLNLYLSRILLYLIKKILKTSTRKTENEVPFGVISEIKHL